MIKLQCKKVKYNEFDDPQSEWSLVEQNHASLSSLGTPTFSDLLNSNSNDSLGSRKRKITLNSIASFLNQDIDSDDMPITIKLPQIPQELDGVKQYEGLSSSESIHSKDTPKDEIPPVDYALDYKVQLFREIEENSTLKTQIDELKCENRDLKTKLAESNQNQLDQMAKLMGRVESFVKLEEARDRISSLKKQLCNFFSDVRNVLNCPIKYDTIEDPVIAPSGVTYEKSMIEKYLKYNKKDPLSKAALSKAKLKPNLMAKALIDVLSQHQKILELAADEAHIINIIK